MWLINVVLIITFIYFIYKILKRINEHNRIPMYIIIDIAIIFEVVFLWSIITGGTISTGVKFLILIFSYLVPISIELFLGTDESFRLNILYAIANMSYALKKYEFTEGILKGAIKKNKLNSNYYYLRAKALEKLGQTAEARDMLFKVVDLDKENKEACLMLVSLLDMEDKKDTALVILAKLLKTYPDYVEAREMLGIIYSELGQDKEAESIYEELSENEAGTYNTYYNLAIIYSKQGEFEKAIDAYTKAIQKNSKLYDAYYALGNIYYANGNYDESIDTLKVALKDSYLQAKIEYALALNYLKKDELDIAANHLEKAIKIDGTLLEKAKRNIEFEKISLELKRLEDENQDLVTVTYDNDEE